MQVIANYNHYKEKHADDNLAARYYDRIEGTAHYFEIISSLYSSYPEQVNSATTLKSALGVLARSSNSKPYEMPGVDNESYVIGAWTGFLLDEIYEDAAVWKNEIMQNPDLTPLDLLAQSYSDNELPEAIEPSEEINQQVKEAIEEMKNKKVAPGIFRMLYQLIF